MDKQQLLAEKTLQQLETMRRSGLFSTRRVRARSTGPMMDQLVHAPVVIDVRSGKEVQPECLEPNQRFIEIPDEAFRC